MSTLRMPVAAAISVAALSASTASFAEETAVPPPQPATQPTSQPAPPPTSQNVTVQQPPAVVAQTTTTAAPYSTEGRDYEASTERRPNRTLLSTGVGLFLLSYGPSVITAAVSDRDADKNMFIPVVGPWIDLADRGCDTRPCGNDNLAKAMIITSGVAQGLGVALGISSLFVPESTKTKVEYKAQTKPSVSFMPVSYAAGAGVGAVGRF